MSLVAVVVDCGDGLVVVVNILWCFSATSFSWIVVVIAVVVVVVVFVVVGGGGVGNESGFIGWLPEKIKRGVVIFFNKAKCIRKSYKTSTSRHLVFSACMGIS